MALFLNVILWFISVLSTSLGCTLFFRGTENHVCLNTLCLIVIFNLLNSWLTQCLDFGSGIGIFVGFVFIDGEIPLFLSVFTI
ncbi:hypothetical protein RchiOBHm_Chr5g0056361 [Rosa chinensis]|uniref:Uncharacterized protein n=1 Tax=Rosa chinensis TaxID=74649 RepID=A0A2P6QGM3_ROSCH|nr:hypothetical protein RchiOBHm_Chr5g0056361 [Rosa chinensis]